MLLALDKKKQEAFLSRGCKCAPQPHTRQLDVFKHSCNKLDAFDWLHNIGTPEVAPAFDVVEVRFKNGRKEFLRTLPELDLKTGDIVAVESSPGHDIGIVSLAGEVVRLQMRSKRVSDRENDLRKVYRKAKVTDIEKWVNAVRQEDNTMFRSREIASSLNLEMKISDVEYQADFTKAIFYYTADDRVDFRELIRVLADAFHVRIEMRQIGMRQEASRLGGIGSCGRELCCATWLTKFKSVSTSTARTQQLSLNPQKLAGQCSKLKCCLNYENKCYEELLRQMPDTTRDLLTQKGLATFVKMDILAQTMVYTYKDKPGLYIVLPVERVRQIQSMNKKGQKPAELADEFTVTAQIDSKDPYGGQSQDMEDSLTRFDKPKKAPKSRRRKRRSKSGGKPKSQ